MIKYFQSNVFTSLLKNWIENFIGVLDSTLNFFFHQASSETKIIISTHEEKNMQIVVGRIDILSTEIKEQFMKNLEGI